MRKGIIQGLHWNSRELNILISREMISFRRNSHCFLLLRNASHMFTCKTHRSPQTSPSFPQYLLPPFLILGNHKPLFHFYGDGVCSFQTVLFFLNTCQEIKDKKKKNIICFSSDAQILESCSFIGDFPWWEDPLEKEKATHFSIMAWRIPWAV